MPLSKILPSGVSQPTPVNAIINGNMSCSQRGTSSTGVGATAGFFTVDRWKLDFSGSGRLTMSQDSSAPSGFANSMKLDCTTADTSIGSGEILLIQQRIEGQNLQHFAKGTSDAKAFAVSFYVKGNASATYVCELHDEDNNRHCSKLFNVTTAWTRVELTFPADTTGAFDDDNGRSLNFNIVLHTGSTYSSGTLNSSGFASTVSANRYGGISSFYDSTDRTFFITGVQLTAGSHHHDFISESYAETLAKCYRYYYKSTTYPLSIANASSTGYSFRQERTQQHSMPVIMRSTPTITAVESIKSLASGSITLDGNVDHVVIYPSGYAGDLPSDNYWYGGYTADAEL